MFPVGKSVHRFFTLLNKFKHHDYVENIHSGKRCAKVVNKTYFTSSGVCVCASQPGGLIVTVAAVTTAVLQGEAERAEKLK